MFPTLPTDTSYTLYSRRHRHGRDIKAGDIVIFENPVFLRGLAIKRVIGMPGDYVVHDPSQSPTVGGAPVDDGTATRASEASASASASTAAGSTPPPAEPTMVQVPEGHVWVAGDNLAYSRDSRFYGPLPMALIQGKCLYNGDGWFSWRDIRDTGLQPVPGGEESD
ncbi:signal peptidase I [Exophiala spinifera]|uniref:Mitochondrial inner membrane protease subunit n=1 Tax=Exophiala spinifera TaxID=91928 RepID=A0A0D2CCE1_9EURO|nr:signal peptidase I [Exophiala spinifera]KIW21164.1 signal peptidase I [Exophiala spinifera]